MAAMWIINSFFLEPYYTRGKSGSFGECLRGAEPVCPGRGEDSGRSIIQDFDSLYSQEGEQNDVSRMLRRMNEQYNTTIVLIDSRTDNMVPDFPQQ